MCAQFLIKTTAAQIKKKFGIKASKDLEFNERVVPYRYGPVIIIKDKTPELHLMNFSLIPSWAKEPKVKFATYNARLDTVTEKPTWKKPFVEKRCLIPMTDFIEAIYSGEHAGFMVGFHDKSEHIMAAAGLWSEWVNPQTGEILESFAILTHEPDAFIKKTGHDRMPVFLKEDAFEEWLSPEKKDPKKLKEFIESHIEGEKFEVFRDRPMKPGWEKRK